jgi:hypothetical protein
MKRDRAGDTSGITNQEERVIRAVEESDPTSYSEEDVVENGGMSASMTAASQRPNRRRRQEEQNRQAQLRGI